MSKLSDGMIKKPVKVCILGAAFDTANMGVSVLAAGALQAVLHRFPGAEIIQMDYGREGYTFKFSYEGASIPVRLVNIRFSKKIYLPNHIGVLLLLALAARVVGFSGLRHYILNCNAWLRELVETDLVLSIAGGDSFSDIYGLKRLLYTSLPQLLALFTKKRLILLPQTIGPFRNRLAKATAKYILRRADRVYCRDHMSERSARSMLRVSDDGEKVRFCYDLGFDVDPVQPSASPTTEFVEADRSAGPLVGVNVSGLLMIGGYDRRNMFGLAGGYERLILRVIEALITEHSARVLLVPHTSGSSCESDSVACEIIGKHLEPKFPGKVKILCNVQYAETKYAIGRCEVFVGARMHACIAALSQAVPAVSLAYSDKFIGVMETIRGEQLVADLRTMTEDDIIRLVRQVFEERLMVRQMLEVRMPLVKDSIRSAFKDVVISPEDGTVPVAIQDRM